MTGASQNNPPASIPLIPNDAPRQTTTAWASVKMQADDTSPDD